MQVDPTLYPKCKYHYAQEPVLVADPDAESALGPDWYDYPHLVKAPIPKRGPGRPPKVTESDERSRSDS